MSEASVTNPLERRVIPAFQWRDRQGNFHNPSDMETKHLFFTLRMIWNHCAPEEMKIYPFQKYAFSGFYSIDYMKEAVKILSLELSKREDMTPYFKRCIEKIIGHLNIHGGLKQLKV